uniref:Adenosylcobinamide-GDP ribazoletransferase n=1 Tax=Candidatus Kentrum sp. TUN TaxID=2126343 RepID=A0A451AEP6_9GAMM|nr:MAG: cobalamin-5'-phosphate synthase [Candidatus Kentron sp. TUN]VFK61250.1 MAG: cobalamin-5'-phosphate synthase [Candidatus Kentron sp. TUN]VFK64491.1 MAG: cobalamin-5'-phosphate synthase [Candidatus Kentron sp. TUN]
MKRLCAALSFLTVIPLPAVCRHTEQDLTKSVAFFPLVGLLIGLSAAGICMSLKGVFPPLVIAVILVGWLVVVQGGLHPDGLADTADGFLSHHGRERVLSIMRDSHIGAFGSLAIMGILALKVAALASLPHEYCIKAVLITPLVGRCIMVFMLNFSPPARTDGLRNLFYRDRTVWQSVKESIGTTIILLGGVWFTAEFVGLFAGVVVVVTMILFVYWCKRRIGGITGDTLGAANEITEMLVLLVLCTQWATTFHI